MSSFDFFAEPEKKEPNLQEVMKQVDDHSFEFDQFDPVDQHQPNEKSFNSDFFANEPQQVERVISAKSRGKSESEQFENSRNLSQISILPGQSFRFQQPLQPVSNQLRPNSRYDKLQQMLSKAKSNNLDMFYKNLQQQQTYQVQDMFSNKAEFNQYRRDLKSYKRQLEDNFKGENGNYYFKDNHYYFPERRKSDIENPFFEEDKPNFSKKNSHKSGNSKPNYQPATSQPEPMNLLPEQYQKVEPEEVANFFDLGDDQIKKQVDKYKKQQEEKQAVKFFTAEENDKRQKKQKDQMKLSQIREQRANLFQLSHDQQKMAKLVANYQQMKLNFNDLMSNLKSTNTDQQKIIKQLKTLKQTYQNKQSRLKRQAETKQEKRKLKDRQKQQKQKKIYEIKEEIGRMKEGDKDILYLKINQKIQNLENIVKNAITTINEEKEQKFVPKIINYYREEEPKTSRSKTNSNNLGLSREEAPPDNEKSRSQSQIDNLMEEQLAPLKNAIKGLKQQRTQEQMLYNLEQFCSPLQLDLTTQQFPLNLSRNRSEQLEVLFTPPEGAKQYMPNSLDSTIKYLRRCLTQKSSIIFESFEFYITGKFTITSNQKYPVLCEVRVANKCAVSLYDIFGVVFGPQAQDGQLQMRPNKIMHDEFKPSSSFLFEVDLSKTCLQSGGFSIMISYKTDTVNKKKVVFKVLLPFVQLIKPQFIYEEQFLNGWSHMSNELYIAPKTLDFKTIRSHQDLKLILPLIEIEENDPNSFSYGIMFHYPTTTVVFMMKIVCYVTGKASIHLKSSCTGSDDKKLRQQILDIMNYLCFG